MVGVDRPRPPGRAAGWRRRGGHSRDRGHVGGLQLSALYVADEPTELAVTDH